MKTVILCGGLGTRLSEETLVKPKPMVEIGPRPILWHILKIYAHHGFKNFLLALGFKGEIIKDYFINYQPLTSDVTVDLSSGQITCANTTAEDWVVQMIDTGRDSLTGGRLHRLERVLRPEGTFMLTYGDGVADVDLKALVTFHRQHGRLATVTAVRPPARFGGIICRDDQVVEFKEKPQTGEGWINGGFMVFEPGVFDYLHGDATVLEEAPLENLARDGQLMA
ncbi:MAG: glucose-1-phosphate cytidylyltransferase, partial [Desulfobaccales bacterium]|nr:glucose-1-phosphate cytidylyltransferase [Desulfobaccales bacterium]